MDETLVTALDRAHAVMEAAPADQTDAARLRFFDRLADAEVFMLLDSEAQGDRISPALFPVEDRDYALIFDLEERLSQFAGGVVPYVAMSGRAALGLMSGAGLGVGVNLDVAPSAMLLPPDAVGWLAGTLSGAPEEAQAQIAAVAAARGLPEGLIDALAAKLGSAGGLAARAYLARVTYQGGGAGHLLAFEDARAGAERALAQAVREALVFSGVEAGALDVAFFARGSGQIAQLAPLALVFELPVPATGAQGPGESLPEGPGMNPEKPPILK